MNPPPRVRVSTQGYVGSPSFLHAVLDVHRRLKEANPDLLFICDPVGSLASRRIALCRPRPSHNCRRVSNGPM